jgi:hypothetical protein
VSACRRTAGTVEPEDDIFDFHLLRSREHKDIIFSRTLLILIHIATIGSKKRPVSKRNQSKSCPEPIVRDKKDLMLDADDSPLYDTQHEMPFLMD